MNRTELRLKYGALLYKKKRFFLSVLGMVIGTASIVVMIAVGEGSKARIMKEFETFSPETITVVAGRVRIRGGRPITTERYTTLKLRDVKALKQIFGVVRVAPVYEGTTVLEYKRNTTTSKIVGSTPDIFAIRRYRILFGRIFTEREAWHNGKVAVIGYGVWKELLSCEDPVGKRIRIRKLPFKVIGVMEKMGTDASGEDLDNQVIIPISSATNSVFNVDYITSIYLQTLGESYLDHVASSADRILSKLHGITGNKPKDYSILKAEEILKNRQRSAMIFTAFIVSIALISIVVGSFGVMAMMILSVKERRIEIGIRKALGATGKDITLQFLEESVFTTLLGGVLGVVSGMLISAVVALVEDYPLILPVIPSTGALLLTVILGAISGLYPARKAAKVDPVETLRG